ncbi:MAG: S8 family serine peptidase [Acidimicrobiales bacterium]
MNIALVEFEAEPTAVSDIAAYQACYGTDATVNYISVDGGASSDPANDPTGIEMALDIEDVIGLAPQATIDVYQAPDGDDYDVYSAIVDSDSDQVVSVSWGECELDSNSSALSSEQSLFDQAATQGQTVLAAAGDNGSTACYGDQGTTYDSTPSVEDPASQPYVVGVGGTSIGADSETVWNDSDSSQGAGGGGVSAIWCMPSYQDQSSVSGIISDGSDYDPTDCGSSVPYAREVPDVSADADPDTGYVIFNDGSWQAHWAGTSAAAPLWAAAAALIDSSPFCTDYGSGDAGALPQGLYTIASWSSAFYALAFNDITAGNNDYTPSGYSGGLYPATTGYNMASGLGSPNLAYSGNFSPGLAAQMCFGYGTKLGTTAITGISPDEGPSTSSTSVTITGSGFLPITGADRLEVGSQSVTVSCTTTSSCTGVLPPTIPGTDNLLMTVEDMTQSPVDTADQFTFVATKPPIVKVTSPADVLQLSKSIVVSYSATDALPVTSYDVRYTVASWNSEHLSNYIYPSTWQLTTYTSETLNGTPGDQYCFNVRARTGSGLVSSWSPNYCATIPLGSASLAAITSGWTRHSAPGYYLGSYVETTNEGSELRLANAGANEVALIVTKCPDCGKVTVYLNGQVLKTVSTYAPTTEHGVVVTLPSFSLRQATIVLKAATQGWRLIIEGLGIS